MARHLVVKSVNGKTCGSVPFHPECPVTSDDLSRALFDGVIPHDSATSEQNVDSDKFTTIFMHDGSECSFPLDASSTDKDFVVGAVVLTDTHPQPPSFRLFPSGRELRAKLHRRVAQRTQDDGNEGDKSTPASSSVDIPAPPIENESRGGEETGGIQHLVASLVGVMGGEEEDSPSTSAGGDSGGLSLEVDAVIAARLQDMGFPEAGVRKALLLNGMNPELAMEWLLTHCGDDDLEAPLTVEQLQRVARVEAAFTPSPDMVMQLQEMGFPREDVTTALRITNNNQEAACMWLLTPAEERPVMSEDESDVPMAEVVQAILGDEVVQEALENPGVHAALERCLADPSLCAEYESDPSVGPVLARVQMILDDFEVDTSSHSEEIDEEDDL